MPEPAATVVIVTKNRSEEALRAVGSAVAQQPAIEVLLTDDGSSGGTAEAVATAYPGVRVQRFERSEGYIERRNQDSVWRMYRQLGNRPTRVEQIVPLLPKGET